jgi:hypothetical protein
MESAAARTVLGVGPWSIPVGGYDLLVYAILGLIACKMLQHPLREFWAGLVAGWRGEPLPVEVPQEVAADLGSGSPSGSGGDAAPPSGRLAGWWSGLRGLAVVAVSVALVLDWLELAPSWLSRAAVIVAALYLLSRTPAERGEHEPEEYRVPPREDWPYCILCEDWHPPGAHGGEW